MYFESGDSSGNVKSAVTQDARGFNTLIDVNIFCVGRLGVLHVKLCSYGGHGSKMTENFSYVRAGRFEFRRFSTFEGT
jgi:hypothetical protein